MKSIYAEVSTMKNLILCLAAVFATLSPLALRADAIDLNLSTGAITDTLVKTPILDGYQYTYTHETLGTFYNENFLNSSTSVVTITYTDVLGTLGVLNVNDVCANVVVFGPVVPCQKFALSFTDLTLGKLSVVAAVGTNVNIAGNVATINFDGSIAAASATIDATGGAGNSPVPEPGTMSLMATGLIGAAGAIRRRLAINS